MRETEDRPLFLLGPIAATLRWLEELANLLSGPLLVVGLGIALVDLLTDGALIAAVPWLLYAWAMAQAVGVDAQLVGAWDRAKRAALQRRWLSLLALIGLGCVLAYVAFVAGWVFAVQQSSHISESQALASLGMNATVWLWQRVGVSVFLVCLSGWTRYRAPRQTSIEDEQAKLERELTLEPLRQQVRHVKLVGVRDAASALVGTRPALLAREPLPDGLLPAQDDPETASPSADDTTDVQPRSATPAPLQRDEAPADEPEPEPPAPEPLPATRRRSPGTGRKPIELQALRTRTRRAALEAQAFVALDANPTMTVDELRRVLGCAKRLASELRTQWRFAQASTRKRPERTQQA